MSFLEWNVSGYLGKAGNNISKLGLLLIGASIGALVVLYLVQIFTMQIVDGSDYALRAQEVTRRSSVLPSRRGDILDRHGRPLATNIDSYVVSINPSEVPADRFGAMFERLSWLLDLSTEQLHQRVPMNIRGQFREIPLRSGVSFETIIQIAERTDQFPGISWRNDPRRYYPDGELFSHILGYVGEITSSELQIMFNRGYNPGSIIGKTGLEQQYDMILRGREGRRTRNVDVLGREIEGVFDVMPPVPGHDVILTVDRDIQRLAANALGERSGAVVVLQVATGEVLAMYSYPGYDANRFMYGAGSAIFNSLSRDTRSPFLNRATQLEAPAASTFKIIMATAALEEELITPDTIINTRGAYRAGNQLFREWGIAMRPQGFGPLDVYGAIANSSNYFFYTLGNEYLGADRIGNYARMFGLGERSGIDIPGERPGLIPSPTWKERTFGEPWVGGDTVNMSIGQGYTAVTPIQMTNVMAMVANRGTVYRPHLVQQVRNPVTGQIVEQVQPEILRSAPIRESTFLHVEEGLRRAVTIGTARGTVITRAVNSVGKTGTGEVGRDDQWHSWYVAYGPHEPEDPMDQVAVVVLVDADNEYDFWSPKAANIILHGIFAEQTYEEAVRTMRPWYLPWWEF
ncbi:MAG: penicillin-binding protein 2 [Spirochaetaceae bacterium]|nr:MAG: penicillin-binding protein 2 [Spirochaetaceae bacterium]